MAPAALRARLATLGISAAHAGRLLDVDERTIRKWYNGERCMSGPAKRLLLVLHLPEVRAMLEAQVASQRQLR